MKNQNLFFATLRMFVTFALLFIINSFLFCQDSLQYGAYNSSTEDSLY